MTNAANFQLLLRLFPPQVAMEEAAYERGMQVLRGIQAGVSIIVIARRLGVSRQRAYKMRKAAEQMAKRPPPVEKYFRQTWDDYEHLSGRRR